VASVSASVVAGLILWAVLNGPKALKGGTAPPTALISLRPAQGEGVVPKAVSELPIPPAYPSADTTDHCNAWANWFDGQGAVRTTPPEIAVSAPTSAPVTVVAASTHVLRSSNPSAITFVACTLGAGGYGGTVLRLNLDHPSLPPTIVTAWGKAFPMPNGVITIAPGQTEYVELDASGSKGLYEYTAQLVFTVNQRTETRVVGSPLQPLRALGRSEPSLSTLPLYDYDTSAHRWRRVG
jgi:hypothetical protein